MPSTSLWLGYYVTVRAPRADGRQHVYFQVPAKLRPQGWSSLIPLPRHGKKPVDLSSAIEVAAVQADARALYEALNATRKGAAVSSLPAATTRKGSIPWLIRKWGGARLIEAVQGEISATDIAVDPGPMRDPQNPSGCSEAWHQIDPRSRKFYVSALRPVFAWSITVGHAHVRSVTPAQIRDFLDRYKTKPGQRKNVRGALSQLFGIALEESELTTNPLDAVKIKKRKRVKGGRRVKVERWTRADVAAYASTARDVKGWRGTSDRTLRAWPGGSTMVRLMYETSADSTDVVTWTKREHLVEREIAGAPYRGVEFDRGKTGVPTFIPLSADLLAELDSNGALFFVVDPFGAPYRPVEDDARLRGHLVTLREKATASGAPYRVFDHLRHSAASEAEESGVDTDKIRHLTAHKDSTQNRQTYIQQSAAITVEIQTARGLLK